MCGIAGFLGRPVDGRPLDAVRAMTDAIAHRGPDADGHWVDEGAQVALGHRRLSIIDLSPEGAQPMTSASGRYVIVFNGEAYNFAPFRAELARSGYPFRGHSDTEVLLAAFDRWGVRDAIPRFTGMFAIAVWDRETRVLTLARDRLGEKPLYFGRMGGAWLFGSELKALRRFPGWRATTSPEAVRQLLRQGYIEAPATIHTEIAKVRPGTMVSVRADGTADEHVYWDATAVARAGLSDPIEGSPDEIADALDAVLAPVVRDEMVADVPLGAFLSGGIDSSLIVSLMQQASTRQVRTFTIGFDDPRFDEAAAAAAVARHLGTDHTEMAVSGADALALVPELVHTYDEPMADSSQLPTRLVARMTRRHVTVALSGDGGDELFGGYRHYTHVGRLQRLRARIPHALQPAMGGILRALPDPLPDMALRFMTTGDAAVGERSPVAAGRLAGMLLERQPAARYAAGQAQSPFPDRLMHRALRAQPGPSVTTAPWLDGVPPVVATMLVDAVRYLPDDILVKVDRAAMAESLETRAPLLDHRVFAFAWRLPMHAKIANGTGKLPLRTLLRRHVPDALIDRPKRGFAVPLADWLRGPLRDWAATLLDPGAIERAGLLDAEQVGRLWRQHDMRIANHADRLWTVLALCAFAESN